METARWNKLKEIFDIAVQMETEARKEYLDRSCEGDLELRRRLEVLLAADEDAVSSDFMETLPIEDDAAMEQAEHLIGKNIGRYHIKSILSYGGMGTVYEAEQDMPKRTVAVKVLNRSAPSKGALKRFEYESQILAKLHHGNIAQVYEAGRFRLSEGVELPYFAMELISSARHITEYVRENRLSIRERIRLFIQALSAVQHGNLRGIIHRDLKPGNILVDESGQVKVIDFGVARVKGSDLQLTTLQTAAGQIIGTLQYMSPEQCEGDHQNLDVRSDVYSLGVVLYELLLDQLPYDVRKTTVIEAARRIREIDPKRPSALNRSLKGDLETVVLTALEKNPKQRYQSVGDLKEDLERHLNNQLILAKPAGPITRAIKTVKRRPVISTGFAAGFISLLAFTLYILLVSYPNSLREQRITTKALKTASDRAQEKEEVNRFFDEMLSAAHPFKAGKDVKVVEFLDLSANEMEGAFPNQPGVEASLRNTIGWSYLKLGAFTEAEIHLRKAMAISEKLHGPKDPDTLKLKNRLAAALKNLDKGEEAEALVRTAYENQKLLLGESHGDTLKSMVNLSKILYVNSRMEESENIASQALDLRLAKYGPDHKFTLDTMNLLGLILKKKGELKKAQELLLETVAKQKKLWGDRNPDTLRTMGNLALLKLELGDYGGAEEIFKQVVKVRREVQGDSHRSTLANLHNLAITLFRQNKLKETEKIQQELLRIRRETLGDTHWETLASMMNLGNTIMNLGRYQEAANLMQEGLELLKDNRQGKDGPYITGCCNLALIHLRLGKFKEAESLLSSLIHDYEKRFGEKNRYILFAKHKLAFTYLLQKRIGDAEPLSREVLKTRRVKLGEAHQDTLKAKNILALCCLGLNKLEEANELLLSVYEISSKTFGRTDDQTIIALTNLGVLEKKAGNLEEAIKRFNSALEACSDSEDPDEEVRGTIHREYGSCRMILKEYDKAETRLLKAYEIFKENNANFSDLKETVEQLIQLYQSWENKEKCNEWKGVLQADFSQEG